MDSNHSSGAPSKLLTVQLLLLIWAPAALAGIYTKWAILRWDGFYKTAISLGRPTLLGGKSSALFTAGETLSFFRADLLLSIVLVPVLVLIFFAWVRPRVLFSLVAVISVAWIAVINVQLEAFRQIGNFQSLDLLQEALTWATANPRLAGSYIVGMAVARLLILISAVLVAWMLASSQKFRSSNWLPRYQRLASAACLVFLGITGLAWLPWMPPTACHSSVHLATLAALPNLKSTSDLASLPIAELKQRYRQISAAPAPRREPANWGKARGYDVLFFVLETTPARCVSFTTPIDDLPNMRALREHAWIGARHHTTFPVTSRAIFSLLTSLYPGDNTKDSVMLPDSVNTGLIHELAGTGYQTGVYGSSASIVPKDSLRVWVSSAFRRPTKVVEVTPGAYSVFAARWSRPSITGRMSCSSEDWICLHSVN